MMRCQLCRRMFSGVFAVCHSCAAHRDGEELGPPTLYWRRNMEMFHRDAGRLESPRAYRGRP